MQGSRIDSLCIFCAERSHAEPELSYHSLDRRASSDDYDVYRACEEIGLEIHPETDQYIRTGKMKWMHGFSVMLC